MGEFGVLIGHTPMLTFIKPGIFSYLDENNEFVKFVVGDGFCEVLKDSVTVLVEEAQRTEEIDPNEATAQLLDLETKLNALNSGEDPEEYARITARMKVARQKVAAAKKS